ncbi:GntR family transcriptional regulator [Rouxiella silvae]|uniref:GntR family transcriptional regulator n=1 Tax=Rouxiella silvae TaxID=1646373 RepID=A0AA41BX36_9GAMM|nr:GntR family transcriptional regulator [Rouxiella silvae]KQN51657.1 GntR family transcriptional regulator [Serratia sp. Leaf50]MBF6637544.1 GntR family transcriptional regulator [Rouxiella silvae]ORJ19428.1 GntR family transcriptional regulator [Rouxiella silvae]
MIFKEIVKRLRDRVNSLEYQIGDILPSELRLAKILGVSRNTIRKAATELVSEGLLERRHGTGTFIKNKNIQPRITTLKSFSENAQEAGKHCENRVLEFRIMPASLEISSQLQIQFSEQVYYVRRLRCIDNNPVQLEDTWMPVALFPNLSVQDMQRSKFSYIESVCGMTIAGCYETFLPVIPNKKVAALLHLSEKDPVLQMSTQAVDINGVRLDYSTLVCNVHEFRVRYFWPRQRPQYENTN